MHNLIPKPFELSTASEEWTLSTSTYILDETRSPEVTPLAQGLAEFLRRETGSQIAVLTKMEKYKDGLIQLSLDGDKSLGTEGYELLIKAKNVLLRANRPAGLFYGIQTLRQLLSSHHSNAPGPSPLLTVRPQDRFADAASNGGRTSLPAVSIRDLPRFAWRGAMLDVARHFFCVEDVKRFIDLIAHYKMNRLHLHLSDDQGWRIEIQSWPRLTEVGGGTQVHGGGGGYYTQEQYKEIVEYARSRFVMVVPEIDTPGHTNAALASYAELNSSEEAPALYEGTEVGFSTLWINREFTYRFLDEVIGELAALTPGPYIHIGGDEAKSTTKQDYKYFIERMQEIVASHKKTAIGWEEITETETLPGTIAQFWIPTSFADSKRPRPGLKTILSPANKTYLDMKYDVATPLGLNWAGTISVKESYDWEPSSYLKALEEGDILGIEAPLWSETLCTMKEIEYMAFPRLPGIAELAWSPKGGRWEEYRQRLALHARHMQTLGINFYRSPDVDWEEN